MLRRYQVDAKVGFRLAIGTVAKCQIRLRIEGLISKKYRWISLLMYIADILEFYVPVRKLLRCNIESIPLMGNFVVLAEDTSQITAGEEDRA